MNKKLLTSSILFAIVLNFTYSISNLPKSSRVQNGKKKLKESCPFKQTMPDIATTQSEYSSRALNDKDNDQKTMRELYKFWSSKANPKTLSKMDKITIKVVKKHSTYNIDVDPSKDVLHLKEQITKVVTKTSMGKTFEIPIEYLIVRRK